MKKISRVLGLVFVYVLFVFAGIGVYDTSCAFWSVPHWTRLLMLGSGPIVGMLTVNTLRGKSRAMLWLPEREKSSN